MDDDALMRQAAGGDTQAFARLVRTYQPRLSRVATRLLNDADTAQDAVVETFLRLWRVRERWQSREALEAFLLRVVRNICLDHARAAHATEPFTEESIAGKARRTACDTAGTYEKQALAAAVREAVQTLPEPQRSVFVLSQYEGLSYAEIAAVLDCPVGTVASRKRLAVETLRRRLWAWRGEDSNDTH